jgi:hypothetical protein
MSTAKLSFAQLPEAGEVKNGDFFVIEDITQAKKLDYKNLIFGLENVTFASTISGQTTSIAALSTTVDTLSSELYTEVDTLQTLIGTVVQTTTANFVNVCFPVNSVLYTATNINPSTFIPNTNWDKVASGLFIAGVGSGVDKNGNGFTVGEGNAASNFNAGEYRHTLTVAEIASHTHTFQPREGTNALQAGTFVESAPGPGGRLSPITSSSTGGGGGHNNIPPVYGLYVWLRTS